MYKELEHPVFESVTIVKIVFLVYIVILASLTILTHLAQVMHFTFNEYAIGGLITTLLSSVFTAVISNKLLKQVTIHDHKALILVLLTGLIGAILALIIHLPDADDYFYVPNAVYYLQHPDQRMGFGIHFIHTGGKVFESIITLTSLPYEYLQAIVAYYSNTEYLFIYHIVFCAIVGFLIPLSYYYVLSHFQSDPVKNILSVFLTIGIILLLGETHRTIGNFFFPRVFQGKIFFIAVGIPLFVALSYDYFRLPSIISWLSIFITSIAMVGATATSIVVLPALASILVLVHLSTSSNLKSSVWLAFRYLLALSYVLLYAIIVRGNAISFHGAGSPQSGGLPLTFLGHLGFFINPRLPLTPYVAVGAFLITLIFCKKRKEILVWVLAALTLYLNPIVAPFVIKHVTSPTIYWRLFYILPFPLIIGIAASCLFEHASAKKQIYYAMGFLIIIIALHLTINGTVFRRSNAQIGLPHYKLNVQDLKSAREIISYAPAGVMLSPIKIAGTVSMLSSNLPQIAYSPLGILTCFMDQPEEAQQRMLSSAFITGENTEFGSLKAIIAKYPDLRSIVLMSSVWSKSEVQEFLKLNRFNSQRLANNNLIVVWR